MLACCNAYSGRTNSWIYAISLPRRVGACSRDESKGRAFEKGKCELGHRKAPYRVKIPCPRLHGGLPSSRQKQCPKAGHYSIGSTRISKRCSMTARNMALHLCFSQCCDQKRCQDTPARHYRKCMSRPFNFKAPACLYEFLLNWEQANGRRLNAEKCRRSTAHDFYVRWIGSSEIAGQ